MTAPVEIGGAGAWDGASVIGHPGGPSALLGQVHWDLDCGNNTDRQLIYRRCTSLERTERIAYLSRDHTFFISRYESRGETERKKGSQLNYAIAVPKRGLRTCGAGPRYIHKWVFLKKKKPAHKASQNANHQSAPTGLSVVEVVWLSIRRIPGRFPSVQFLVHSEEV